MHPTLLLIIIVAFGDTVTICQANPTPETLRMIAIVHRNGHRTPEGTYPKDPYLGVSWPGGEGALTQKGSKQMFEHGQKLRLRYSRLVKGDGLYSYHNINIRSSSSERAIMSAQSFMAGFLPPMTANNLLPIWWQPTAVTSISQEQDNLIHFTRPCARYDKEYANLLKNPPLDIQQYLDRFPDLYDNITDLTGVNVKSFRDALNLSYILILQKDNGLILPEWAEELQEILLPLASRCFAMYSETEFMKRARGGILFTDILDHFVKKSKGLESKAILVYSGHDLTLTNLMNALGFLEEMPAFQDYGATVVFELHQNLTLPEVWKVRVSVVTGDLNELVDLKLFSTFSSFITRTQIQANRLS